MISTMMHRALHNNDYIVVCVGVDNNNVMHRALHNNDYIVVYVGVDINNDAQGIT